MNIIKGFLTEPYFDSILKVSNQQVYALEMKLMVTDVILLHIKYI